jgi:hypothetical protein
VTTRTVTVRSPSLWGEAKYVVLAVFQILFWSAMVTGALRPSGKRASTPAAPGSIGFEVAFRDLAGPEQRMFRRCLEGLTEAEDVRGRTGQWPSVEELAARNIPPFATDPVDTARYRWRLLRDGTLVNYVGVPEGDPARPALAIIVLEPDPGTPADPTAPLDETHHRLTDGTLLHVAVWSGPKLFQPPMWSPPVEKGWRRITMVTP